MLKIGNINFACDNPALMAVFWSNAIGYVVEEAPPEFMKEWIASGRDPNGAAAAIDPEGKGPRFFFVKTQKRPETDDTCIPIHLDLTAEDLDNEVVRLLDLGASVVEQESRTIGEFTEKWVVMKDPEGNGFCVQG